MRNVAWWACALLAAAGWQEIACHRDLNGQPRCVLARAAAPAR